MHQLSPETLHSYASSFSPELWGLSSHLKMTNARLFDDAVLPYQLYVPPEQTYRNSGEAALMRAILDDAINCFQRQFVAKDARSQRLAKEAETWLLSNEEEWIFSFLNICSVLGIEPTRFRRKLRSLQDASKPFQRKKQIVTRRPQCLRLAA